MRLLRGLRRLKGRLQFQVYWPSWYSLPWLNKTKNEYNDFAWNEYWFGFSIFQFRWKGKPWPTRLVRSPEWSEGVKKLLLEELNK